MVTDTDYGHTSPMKPFFQKFTLYVAYVSFAPKYKESRAGKVGQWVKCFPEFRLPAPTHLQVQSLALVTPALRWEGAERSPWSSLASRGGWIRALLAFLREPLSETKVKSSWGTPDTYQWLARVREACARPPTWTCAQHTSYRHNLRNTWKSKIIKHIN